MLTVFKTDGTIGDFALPLYPNSSNQGQTSSFNFESFDRIFKHAGDHKKGSTK